MKTSVSALGTYESCPRKYKYQVIDKLPRKAFEHLDVGNYVHEVLEKFHIRLKEDATQHPETLIKALAKECWDKYSLKISPEGLEKSKGMLKQYLLYIGRTKFPNVHATEDKFSIKINEDIELRGVVDRIDILDDGKYQITDYKSGQSKYLDDFQLKVYGLHLKNLFPEVEEYKGLYIVLPEGPKELEYVITMADVQKAKDDVIQTATDIMQDKTWDPKPTFLCRFCDYSEICPDSYEKRSNKLYKIGRTTFE